MSERELFAAVDLCDEHGRLNAAAVGWSRRPLHRANLSRAFGRKKRWDYWCVTSPDLFVALTYADIDYLGTASVWMYQPSTGLEVSLDRLAPFGRGFELADDPCTGTMVADLRGLRVEIDEQPLATRLLASAAKTRHGPLEIDITVDRPPGHESLNVVIPWSAHRFQFTSKQNTRPAHGTVRIGGTAHVLGDSVPAYGTLDLGRGVWRYENRWNWAAGSGTSNDGRIVGLQFGGKWTAGTGLTENGICIDGKLHKIGTELEWLYDWDDPMRPWQVRDPVDHRVDVRLVPIHDRHSRTSLGLLSMEVHQCFGAWSGTVVTDSGKHVEFQNVIGFAEEARNRW